MMWIRTDANSKIGAGHLMRCLSVADAVRGRGGAVRFIVSDEAALPLLREKGYDYQVLAPAGSMDDELSELLPLLEREKPDVLLTDSYLVTRRYLEQVRRYTKTAYMDDLAAFAYPVDLIINYNIYADELSYAECAEEGTRLLLGPAYVPLRREFTGQAYSVRKQAEHILLSTGGSDRYDLAGQILREALFHPETAALQYHVVSGAFNEHLPELTALAKQRENVHIHQNVKDMAELMRQCDIAAAAGGSTVYELCTVGIPVVCFSFVDNQERLVEAFTKKELVCYSGNYIRDGASMVVRTVEQIARLAADAGARAAYSGRGRRLVDGLGAERIAEALSEYFTGGQN